MLDVFLECYLIGNTIFNISLNPMPDIDHTFLYLYVKMVSILFTKQK